MPMRFSPTIDILPPEERRPKSPALGPPGELGSRRPTLRPIRTGRRDMGQYALLAALLISTTFLQKFGIAVSSESSLSLGLFLIAIVTVAGLAFGTLKFHGRNLVLYLLIATALIGTQILGDQDFSKPSLALLLAVHLPYVVHFRRTLIDPEMPLRLFQKVALIMAFCGVAQFALQFIIGWHTAFILDTEIPKQFLDQGYMPLNPVGSSGHIYRSNGFFMLEASLLSQLMAVAMIIEFLHFRRLFYIAAFAGALIVAYSGTGLIVLAVVIPLVLMKRGRLDAVLLLGALLFVLVAFASELQLQVFIDRIDEFQNVRSSGFARFLSIFYLIDDFLLPDPSAALFGMGAGSIGHMMNFVYYKVHDPSWGKLVFEYGFLGAAVYLPCMAVMVFGTSQHKFIKLALAIQFLALGGYLLTPIVHVLMLALVVWPYTEETSAIEVLPAAEEGEISRDRLLPRRMRAA